MAMWDAAQETKVSSFTSEFGRDVAVLSAGMILAFALAAVGAWSVQPASLLAGWNGSVALWSLAPALALLVAHWQAAKAWMRDDCVPHVDPRATTLAALLLTPAVLVLSASVVAALVGTLGGPTHPNSVADDLTFTQHLVRALTGAGVSALVVGGARYVARRR